MRPAHCTRRPLKAIGAARSKVSRAGPAEALPDVGTGSHGRHRRLRLEAGERDCEGFGAHPAAQHHRVAPANAFHFVRGASNKLSDPAPGSGSRSQTPSDGPITLACV